MFFKEHKNIVLLFAGVLGQNHLERFSEIEKRIFRGDDGIGAAPRLAAAHATQTRPVAVSIKPQVRVPVSHILLLVLF